MTTATKSRKRVKPERRVTIGKPVNGVFALAMTIGAGEKAKHFGYYVQSIPADFGLAFHFEKFSTEQEEGKDNEYDVNIDLQRGRHSCTCKGNTYSGHCKHVEALVSLIQSGKIDVPTAKPQAPQQPQAKPEAQQPAKREPWCKHCNDNPNVYCPRCSL
jgi:hypothetical protein